VDSLDIDYNADLFWAEDLYENLKYEEGLIRIDSQADLMRRVLKAFIFHTREMKRIVDANR
jgi:hypothetical protein